MRDVGKKNATSTSKYPGVTWDKNGQKYRAKIRFSNNHVKAYMMNLGYFGTKGDQSTGLREAPGETEAGARYALVSTNVDRINELLKNIRDRQTFINHLKEEVAKL